MARGVILGKKTARGVILGKKVARGVISRHFFDAQHLKAQEVCFLLLGVGENN